MNIKTNWNNLITKLKIGKALKIRPDNLALYSTKKVFLGNPHKPESYLLKEGMDAIGLKVIFIPKNVKKIQEMIDLAISSSSSMTSKQIRKVESLLFDFLYKKSNYSVSSHIKTILEDFSRMVITSFKFAESNERSVESTFFLYIIANPSFSLIKDMIVLIGLLTLYLPLLYWALILRLEKNIQKIKNILKGKTFDEYLQLFISLLSPAILNLILFFVIKIGAEKIFLLDKNLNTDYCFANKNYNFEKSNYAGLTESCETINFLLSMASNVIKSIGLDLKVLGHHQNNIIVLKLIIFGAFFLITNLIIFIAKQFLKKNTSIKFPKSNELKNLQICIVEVFSRLFLSTFVAANGIYR